MRSPIASCRGTGAAWRQWTDGPPRQHPKLAATAGRRRHHSGTTRPSAAGPLSRRGEGRWGRFDHHCGAPLAGLARKIRGDVPIPLLDGVSCAVAQAELMVARAVHVPAAFRKVGLPSKPKSVSCQRWRTDGRPAAAKRKHDAMSILITGASGFIGLNLAEALLARGGKRGAGQPPHDRCGRQRRSTRRPARRRRVLSALPGTLHSVSVDLLDAGASSAS